MPGRHIDQRPSRAPRPSRSVVALATVVVLATAGLIGWAFVGGSDDGECGPANSVAVTVDPTIENQVRQLAEMYSSDQPDGCADVTVTAQESAEAATKLTKSPADLWIPDSSYWRSRLTDPELVNSRGTIATSPLVGVTSRQVAEKSLGWPQQEFSWAKATTSGVAMTIPDPSTTTEGIGTLFAVSAMQKDASSTDLVRAMTTMSKGTVATTSEAYQTLQADADPAVFTAAEQTVIAHNRDEPKNPVVALYPAEGTISFDFPAFVVADSPSASVATDFADYLGSSASHGVLQGAGFRTGAGELSAVDSVGIEPAQPEIISGPDPAAVKKLNRLWSALSLDMRMLSVVDISGSMNDFVDEDSTRIELTRDAAKTALALIPPDSEVGMWVFSTLEENDYAELAPVAPLNESSDGQTHAETLRDAADELPDLVGDGGTPLYDTTLAAFEEMQANYEPKKVNSVVIMTDGRDEFDDDGIDLETLVDELKSQFDPEAPVSVIGIGIGPDADIEALEQVSAATGASSYQADDPRDIETVFLQAMLDRQCRPNC